MVFARRWDPCVSHNDVEASAFISEYFKDSSKNVLVIAGAGFDPRSTVIPSQIAATGVLRTGLFIRENRTDPVAHLLSNAEMHVESLNAIFPTFHQVGVDIFGTDGATIAGRNAINAISKYPLDGYTDLVIDVSALSLGVAFPLAKYLISRGKGNVHIFVAHDPTLDNTIVANKSDKPTPIHGFGGGFTLDQASDAAKLWLPQLCHGRKAALNALYAFVGPHDTCPIIPFPAQSPRMGDDLSEHFITELESTWSVDTRNIVYASEDDPLDLYRTILRLDDVRRPIFAECNGSLLVLSPLGSKVMALGCMMAALERNLPIIYLEALGYTVASEQLKAGGTPRLVHLWLEGDVYPSGRPPLPDG